MNLIAQTAGIIGTILCLSCYNFKNRKNILIIKHSSDIMWAVHYFLLGAFPAFIVNVVCAIREIIYIFEKNKKRRYVWLGLFICTNWISAAVSWENITSIIPATVTTIAAYSFWQKNIKVTRLLALLIASLMFTYDIFVKSYIGLLNESLTILSVTIALLRFKKKPS